MLHQLFATKKNMGQAWTKSGLRLVTTKIQTAGNGVVAEIFPEKNGYRAFQIGFGKKKLKNMTKPLKAQLDKSGFSFGVRQIREVKVPVDAETSFQVGDTLSIGDLLKVGDIVDVQGKSKGKGFAGVIKRHGFHGGSRTHGQSDRERAPGAIGQRTTPGRVFKGKRMAGHLGDVHVTVRNLQVISLNAETGEVLLNGPIPGSVNSIVRLTVRGHQEFEGLEVKKSTTAEVAEVKAYTVKAEPEVKEETVVEDTTSEKENA